MCTTSESPDHPEYHITQGHNYGSPSAPFTWGTRPLVLRYITTPAGSIAWKKHLAAQAAATARKAREEAAAEERRQAHLVLVADRVFSAAQGGAATVTAMAAATGFDTGDIQVAVHQLVADGRLVYDGRRLISGHRWRPATGT